MPRITENYSTDDRYRSASEDGHPSDEDRIDFGALFNLVWRDLWLVAVVIIGFLVLGAIYLHTVTPKYTVSMQVVAADIDSRGGQESGGSQLAGLIGLNLPETQGQMRMALYLQYMTSVDMGDTIFADKAMLHRIFKGQWDEQNKRWRPPPAGINTIIKNAWDRLLGYPVVQSNSPTPGSISSYLQSLLDTEPAQSGAPVTVISFRTEDSHFGLQLLSYLHEKADAAMRERALRRSSEYIVYLRQQLDTVTRADQREALIATLSSQEETRMAASSNLPYSVDVFSRAVASDGPTSPKPSLIYVLCAILGFVISLVLLFLLNAFDTSAAILESIRQKISGFTHARISWGRHRVHRIVGRQKA